jgi:phosphoribosylformylglycinamidine synthase
VHGQTRGTPPWIDLDAEKRLHRLVLLAAQERLLRSAHDVAEGGLAVALAECSFAGARLGFRVALEGGMRTDALLFGESQSRMLVSVRRKALSQVRDLARREDVPYAVLGEVRGHSLVSDGLIDVPLEASRERWRRALERRVGG